VISGFEQPKSDVLGTQKRNQPPKPVNRPVVAQEANRAGSGSAVKFGDPSKLRIELPQPTRLEFA
jgi:hypothetical protein